MFLEIFGSSAIFSVVVAATTVLMYHYYLSQTEGESVVSEGINGLVDSELSDRYPDNFNPHRKLQRLNYRHSAKQVSVNDTENYEGNKKIVKIKNVYLDQGIFQACNDESLTDKNHNTEYNEKEYDKSIFDEINNDIPKFGENFKRNENFVKHTNNELSGDHDNKENNVSDVNSSDSMLSNIEDKGHFSQNSLAKSAYNIAYEQQDDTVDEFDQKYYQCIAQKITSKNLKYKSEAQLTDITPPNEQVTKSNFNHANGKEAKDDVPLLRNQFHKFSSSNVNYDDLAEGNTVNNDSNILSIEAKNYISPLCDLHLKHKLNYNGSSNCKPNNLCNVEFDNKTVDQEKENKELYKHKVWYNDLSRKEKNSKDLDCKGNSSVLIVNTPHLDFSAPCATIGNAQIINEKNSSSQMLHAISDKGISSKPAYRQRLYDKYKKRKVAYSDPSYKGQSKELSVNTFEGFHLYSASTDKKPINSESNPENSLQEAAKNEDGEEQSDTYGNQVQFQEQNANQLLSVIILKINSLKKRKYIPLKIKSLFTSVQKHFQTSAFNHRDAIFSSLENSASIEETGTVDIGIQNSLVTESSDLQNYDSNSEEQLCKGCMGVSANAVNVPCGHCYLCIQCSRTVLKIYKKCCICNNNVTSFEHIDN